jgi:D-ribose pyranose/furanose isomerase RbsD
MLSYLRIPNYLLLGFCSLSMLVGCVDPQEPKPWMGTLRQELGYLGARNWIVIAEAAFPVQSRRGLRVIQLDADIPEVLEGVEDVIAEKHHVKPRVYVTAELENVPYDYAPGVRAHKKSLEEALHGRETVSLDNDMLMRLLADTSKSYRVLVIKTRTALPYSTVFIELGSGYWDAESEAVLRANMEKKR